MTRLEKWAQAKKLRGEGLKLREIGERMGLATSTVHDLLTDPTGDKARARKAKDDGTCVDCGGRTSYDVGGSSERCASCRREFERSVEYRRTRKFRTDLKWSDEECLDAIRSVAVDGVVSSKAYELARNGSALLPSMPLLAWRFGRWADAAAAAGLKPSRDRVRADYLTEAGAWMAIEECEAALGRVPTTREYEEWAAGVGAPCLTTVRRRVGGWRVVLERTEEKAA